MKKMLDISEISVNREILILLSPQISLIHTINTGIPLAIETTVIVLSHLLL